MSRGDIGTNAACRNRASVIRFVRACVGINFRAVAVRQKFLTFSSFRPLRRIGIGIIV
jgi:hypothetical protein